MDIQARIAAVRAVLRGHQVEQIRAESAGPSCEGCFHLVPAKTGPYAHHPQICGHLAYTQRRYDRSAGKFVEEAETSTDEARADDGLCGFEAIMYEPKFGPVKVWTGRAGAAVSAAWLACVAVLLVFFTG